MTEINRLIVQRPFYISVGEADDLNGKEPEVTKYAILISPPNKDGDVTRSYVSPVLYSSIMRQVLS